MVNMRTNLQNPSEQNTTFKMSMNNMINLSDWNTRVSGYATLMPKSLIEIVID